MPPKKKIHRKKAWYTLMTLDNQLRLGAGISGLEHFKVGIGEPQHWPVLSVCVDQESSNISAISYIQRVLRLNIDPVYDVSHACWNDIRCSIKDAGDWSFALMLLASWGMKHGPWMQSGRLHEISACVEEYKKQTAPDKCEFFKACLPMIARDRREEH